MNDESWAIEDGPEFGELLRRIRWRKGFTENGLARKIQEAYPKAMPLKLWVTWVKEAEQGLIKSVDFDRVLAAATALEVPVSTLLPVPEASLENVGPTVREQLLSLGMTDEEVHAFDNVLDLDGPGLFIACSPNTELDEGYLLDREEP